MIRFYTPILMLLLQLRVCCAQAANATACSWSINDQMGSSGGGIMFFLGFLACAILALVIWLLVRRYGAPKPAMPKPASGSGWHIPFWHSNRVAPGDAQPAPGQYQPGNPPAPGLYPPGPPPAQNMMGWYYPGLGLTGYRTEYELVPQRA